MGDHLIPFYRLETSDGIVADVPKYIRRLAPRNGDRLWQIAFNRISTGPFTRAFSDNNGDPHTSLKRATDELRRFLASTPNRKSSGLALSERKQGKSATGLAGVRYWWRFHKRTGLYELKLEARAGQYRADSVLIVSLGTEFSLTPKRLQAGLMRAVAFRKERIRMARESGQLIPAGLENELAPALEMSDVIDALKDTKERLSHQHVVAVERRVTQFMDSKRPMCEFRFKPIRKKHLYLEAETIRVPDFIDIENDALYFSFRLPDGSLYGDRVECSDSIEEDIKEIMRDCFHESIMTIPSRLREYRQDNQAA